jgi:hypothetical protein
MVVLILPKLRMFRMKRPSRKPLLKTTQLYTVKKRLRNTGNWHETGEKTEYTEPE